MKDAVDVLYYIIQLYLINNKYTVPIDNSYPNSTSMIINSFIIHH